MTERRTAVDFAEVVRWLVEEVHEEAEKVVLVMDNLNTHKIASLYEAFPPERRGGSPSGWRSTTRRSTAVWLNMAEIELSVLARQCLDRRIESAEEPGAEVAAWEEDRNERRVGVKWRFTTADARIKLHRLYPQLNSCKLLGWLAWSETHLETREMIEPVLIEPEALYDDGALYQATWADARVAGKARRSGALPIPAAASGRCTRATGS